MKQYDEGTLQHVWLDITPPSFRGDKFLALQEQKGNRNSCGQRLRLSLLYSYCPLLPDVMSGCCLMPLREHALAGSLSSRRGRTRFVWPVSLEKSPY